MVLCGVGCGRAQFGAIVLNCLMLFLLMFGTYLFQVGLIGTLLSQFREIMYIIPVYVAALGAQAGIKVSLMAGAVKTPPSQLWDNDLFFVLTVVKLLGTFCCCLVCLCAFADAVPRTAVAVVYYIGMLRTIVKMGDLKLYKKSSWVSRFQTDAS